MESSLIIGIVAFALLLIFVLLGVPIFVVLLAEAFFGFWLVGGLAAVKTQFTSGPYNFLANYTFASVVMFILMGELAAISGAAENAYVALSKWLGRIPGGMLMATIGAGAVFGACSGSTLASSAIFTRIALPELEKYNYDKGLSTACIACSGTLASLIPPSMWVIVVCMLTQISIGKLLIAGVMPGILATIAMMIGVWVLSRLSRRQTTAPEKVSLKEKVVSLTGIWPILFLFLLVIGGIYLGIFTPTAGGAVGAFGALVYTLTRRANRRGILNTFYDTAAICGRIFPIAVAGIMFSRFIALSGLINTVMDSIVAIHLPSLAIVGMWVIIYLILGCILDQFAMLVITIPFFIPIMSALGYSDLTSGILLVILINVAGLTPPIGMQVYIVAGIANIDSGEVFRGIVPFFLMYLVVLWIIILFPQIATWLPGMAFKY
jgi:C4-dicarboxylate transporter DctM subunit